jgi:peptidoglycan-N-acetylglucosamine deacetylase
MLLHDVEEPLPGDARGLESVREGTVACLELEARYGIRATYNLVGTFAKRIPDLVARMDAEGHEIASHSTSHREIPGLDAAALMAEVRGAEDLIGRICGRRIRGFRSPRSRWTGPLLDLLGERGYLWNAEADASPYPYPVPRRTRGGLLRIPVAVDDWDYVRHHASPRQVRDLWKSEVLTAEARGCWVGIGSHPSVLGIEVARQNAFKEFLEWLSGRDVRVMTLEGASAWWRLRIPAAEPGVVKDRA